MPYKVKGKCVYKKDTGKKVGCTKGPVKKYLAALHINAHEESKKMTITQKDALAAIRKPMPPPSKSFKDNKKYSRKQKFKEFYESMGTLRSEEHTSELQSH